MGSFWTYIYRVILPFTPEISARSRDNNGSEPSSQCEPCPVGTTPSKLKSYNPAALPFPSAPERVKGIHRSYRDCLYEGLGVSQHPKGLSYHGSGRM